MDTKQRQRLKAWASAWRDRDAKAHRAAFDALTDDDVRAVDFRLRVDGGDLSKLVADVLGC